MKKRIKKLLKSVSISILIFLVSLFNGPSPVLADTISDSFADTTKINTGASSGYQVTGGQLKLGEIAKRAWWKMDETSGTTVADSSGNGYNGTSQLTPTGGTITYSGGYTIHTFTSSGTFTSYQAMNVETLVVAGGGGGGYSFGAGGGGGGVLYETSHALATGNFTVTVGNGGARTGNHGANGENSVFDNLTAIGGGGGGWAGYAGYNGGSGGGGGKGEPVPAAGTGTAGQGNNGGTGSSYFAAGGGGGAGGVGGNAGGTGGHIGGAGGAGRSISISGSAVYYGGGGSGNGDGGSYAPGTGGTSVGQSGTANTGAGGGGDGATNFAGGSGIVIIRYLTPPPGGAGPAIATGGVISYTDTHTTHTFSPSVFHYTGADQTYTVPAGVTSITVKMWGGGGGGGNLGGWTYGFAGGGGGYTTATLAVTPGQVLTVMVGAGGGNGSVSNPANSYGGGGRSCGGSDCRYGGQGGGRSAIRIGSTEYLTAGGGGGGGSSRAANGQQGGAGGGSTGADGISYTQACAGKGGGQSAGGAGGSCPSNPGGAGTQYTGGNPWSTSSYGGAGGGGWYGGGAGGYAEANDMGGGGGGSGYIGGTGVTNATTTTGSGATPANAADADRGYAGTGGIASNNGIPGKVIIAPVVSQSFVPTSSFNVEALVVAGGGGGGMDMGGGGGGGGVIYNSSYAVTPQTYPITVGLGGTGGPAGRTGSQPTVHQFTLPAINGQNSVFGTLTAIGGGRGGSSPNTYTPGSAGAVGGSGGGASGYNNQPVAPGTVTGGAGTGGQGYAGGNQGNQYYSGGGGGAGGAGASGNNQANGGIGYQSSINGTSLYWGGGGGGAGYSVCGGNGGAGGGGGGAVCTTTGGAGLNNGSTGGGGAINSQTNTPGGNGGGNTGGGGGGGSHYNLTNKGGDGGSGAVIIRYPTPPNIVAGQTGYGNARSFDGTTNYLSFGSFEGLSGNGGNTTIEAWVYPTEAADNNLIFAKGNDATANSYLLNYSGNAFYLDVYTSSLQYINTAASYPINNWYHVAGIINGQNLSIYVNGTLAASGTFTGTLNTSSNSFWIGGQNRTGYNYFYKGNIDDVRIYQTVLTQTQITNDMNNGTNYSSSGTIVSNNLLTGVSGIDGIDEFVYNLSSIPAGTTATVQFSQNGTSWYNSSNVLDGTDTLTTGTNNTINIHVLGWSGANFYYKTAFTGGDTTPVLDDVNVNYTVSGYTNTSTSVTDNYTGTSLINNSSSSNYVVGAGALTTSIYVDTGDGADGGVTISANKNINTDIIATGRSTYADGIMYAVSALGTNTITTSATANGIAAADEVLLVNLQGDATNNGNVGNYEFLEVQSVSGTLITLASNLTKTYGVGGNANLTGQKIMVQRVPNYTSLTVNNGITLSASAFNGSIGGVLAFRAGSTVTNNGYISTAQTGYRGGVSQTSGPETITGLSTAGGATGSTAATGACTTDATGAAGGGTGGGAGGASSGGTGGTGAAGKGGGGGGANYTPSAGGAGGKGGGGGAGTTCWHNAGGGGGGAAYDALSTTQNSTTLKFGPGASQGAGGGGGGAGAPANVSTGGGGGGQGIGTGGNGGAGGNAGVAGANGTSGQAGGGIIFISATSIINNIAGGITASGGNGGGGGNGGTVAGGGGGGSGGPGSQGGQILLNANDVSSITNGMYAKGGNGGAGGNGGSAATAGGTGGSGGVYTNGGEAGGGGTGGIGLVGCCSAGGGAGGGGQAGGAGRIDISTNTISGTTSPTANVVPLQSGLYFASATIQSTNLLADIQSINNIDSFDYSLTSLPAGTSATVQFSQNGTVWYNSSGVSGGTNSLSAGVNSISLSGLAWANSYFFYKINYTTDGNGTPSLDYITVNYTTSTSTIGSTWAACVPQTGGDFTLSSNCYFPNTRFSPSETNVDGVDRGDITVQTYKTLTIRGDQQIARNNRATNNGKGVLTIQNGASIAISDIPIGGTGGNVRDFSGNGNEGTPGTAIATTVVAGKYGTARSFNGSTDYISLGDATSLKPSNITIETWFKTNTTNGSMLIRKRGYGYGLEIGNFNSGASPGQISFWIYDIAPTLYTATSPLTYNDGNWHHAAGVYNGTTVTLYIDGNSVDSSPAGTITYNDGLVALGRDGDSSAAHYNGSLDDVRLYNYALTQAQITDDMNYGSVNKAAPIAWYRFEDGGQIKETNLWVKDEDGDAWAQSYETQQRAQTDSPGTGWIRRYLSIGSAFGDARDGNITFTTNTNLNTWNHTGRACADGGDAVTYSISSLGSTTLPNGNSVSTATLTGSVSSGCINAGDNVLVLNGQGTSTNYTNTGNYELLKVYSVSGTTITFTSAKKKYYGNGATDDTNIGTATTNQRVMLQRVPQYGNVTVNSGVELSPNTWDGTKGGVLAFVAKGTVTVTGTIQSSAKGYRGSTATTGGGEAFCSLAGGGGINNGGAGGAGGQYAGCEGGHPVGYDGAVGGTGGSAVCGGGGGASAGGAGGGSGEGPCSGYQNNNCDACLPGGGAGSAGAAGSGTASLGGGGGNGGNGGGGGGFGDLASVFNNPYTASTGGGAGQGGGGGYGTLGTGGSGGSVGTTGAGCQSGGCGCAAQGAAGASGGTGVSGGTSASGNGGSAGAGGVGGGTYAYCAGAGNGGGGAGGGGGGGTYGIADLSKIYFGAGGGKGGGTGSNGGYDNGTNGAPGGAGGTGNGTNGGAGGGIVLIYAKTLTATGVINATGAAPGGNGGGGAGGAIKILGDTLTLGSSLVTALGGGNGGSGRVAIGGVTVTGTANPTFTSITAP